MSKHVINTNPHLREKENYLREVAKATIASFKLEGIELSFEEALQMARESVKKINPTLTR